jgi:hypothetical protein
MNIRSSGLVILTAEFANIQPISLKHFDQSQSPVRALARIRTGRRHPHGSGDHDHPGNDVPLNP